MGGIGCARARRRDRGLMRCTFFFLYYFLRGLMQIEFEFDFALDLWKTFAIGFTLVCAGLASTCS
jgi:hypothetical protein